MSESALRAALERFRGEIEQVPPMYAAIKHQGRPLYSYARRGEQVDRAPRRVVIRRLDLVSLEGETASVYVECSKGTYIRTLAEDIGAVLGCGAHLAALERLAVGSFTLRQSVKLEDLEGLSLDRRRARLLPPQVLLQSWPRLRLPEELTAKFRHGQAVPADAVDGNVAVFGEGEVFLGTGEVSSRTLQPRRLLAAA